jgi:5S rRNA maturation endonuclease (ribonuclease M5)
MNKEKFREKKKLEEVTRKLDRDVDSVIVEGYSDKQVMKKLGFEGRIFLSAERTTEDLAEDVARASERVAILTDFDQHGKEENKEILQELQDKVDVINASRREFGAQLTSTGRRTIEDAAPLFESKQRKFVEAALDTLFFRD